MDTGQTPQTDTPEGGDRRSMIALIVVGVLGAIAVNIAAFVLSAAAITAVAEAAGISKKIAWVMVGAVDGLMITGTVVFIANKLRRRSVWYPLTVLAAGVLLSIVCNALHSKAGGGHVVQLGDKAKMAVSAIPAVSLALSFHLIADMVKEALGGHVKSEQEPSEEKNITVPASDTERSPSARQPLSGPTQTFTRPDNQTTTPAASQTRQTSAPRTTPDRRSQTTTTRPSAARQTSRKETAKAAMEAPSKVVPIDRDRVRALLLEDRDRTSADVAQALGRADTGTLRTVMKSIRAELDEADNDRRLHAVNE